MEPVPGERELVATALSLGARDVAGWSAAEEALVRDLPAVTDASVQRTRRLIAIGRDPLGDAFCALRSPAQRRPNGATYTPLKIARVMVRWAAGVGDPARVVDPGTGSGRFLVAAGRRFPTADLIGLELDP